MDRATGLTDSVQADQQELGVVICMNCNEVLFTLPTNGYKKIYGICPDNSCADRKDKSGE
ncbi:GapA-binding peptide SR1P [Cohnella nanjingensis]|uniref:GapA-binding peptide SR1P n=1 Tax=Cohnella nanjingensis TaxID=1387779 RepID=A0A7X0RRW9_9BACL|nr:GapA-binding peptide SR1P [Cohnella nanjingensis]MBB6671295.1 GapA-binding peptide SR1P [Cohnella nanjingensis]